MVCTSGSPMVRGYFDQGPWGDFVRWTAKPGDKWHPEKDRKERWFWGERKLVKGTGPDVSWNPLRPLRVADTPQLSFIRLGDLEVVLGWAFTAWVLYATVRRLPILSRSRGPA